MVEIGNKNHFRPIELSDREFETSLVLHHVFDLLIKRKSINDIPDERTPNVIRFLRKYELDRELEICSLQLNTDLLLDKNPWKVFLRSAYLEDHELGGRALDKARTWSRTGGNLSETVPEVFGLEVPKGRVVDFRTISRKDLGLLPLDSLWAFLRASAKLPMALTGSPWVDISAMSEEYVRLMKLRGESSRRIRNCG